MQQRPDIFQFGDYREFLRAYETLRRTISPRWSLGVWARTLQLAGTASLSMVINGQRHAGSQLAQRLIAYFDFDAKEAGHFRDLVNLAKHKDDGRLRAVIEEKLKDNSNARGLQYLDDRVFNAISEWYFLPIREMTLLHDFREDPFWISERLHFHVSPHQANRAIKTLLELGLLLRTSDGRLGPSNPSVAMQPAVPQESVKRYHEQVIDLAKDAQRRFPMDAREFAAQTITVKASDLPRVKTLIRDFQDKLDELVECRGGDTTMQLNIQLFPLTSTQSAGSGTSKEILNA